MSDLNLIAPGAPFIPEQPPTVVERQIWEWSDRADLAEHAFDGQWRVLCTYERFGLELMERWLPADGVEGVPLESRVEHCLRKMQTGGTSVP